MRRAMNCTFVIMSCLLLAGIAPANAAVTSTPTAQASQGVVLNVTPDQKAFLREAKKTLNQSIATAKSAYSLLVADAKANQDQLILMAHANSDAISAAKAQFREALSIARTFLDDALKQAKKTYQESLTKKGLATN